MFPLLIWYNKCGEEHMRCYTVVDFESPTEGIGVALRPRPHIWLGEDGMKPPYWVRIKMRDSVEVIRPILVPCGGRVEFGLNAYYLAREYTTNPWAREFVRHCTFCGTRYTDWKWKHFSYERHHPNTGKMVTGAAIFDVDVVPTYDRGQGDHLLVKPGDTSKNALILMRYSNRRYVTPRETTHAWQYQITCPQAGVNSLCEVRWDSEGNDRVVQEVVEWLFILEPGITLHFTKISAPGLNIYAHQGSLTFDGEKFTLT